MKPIKVRVIFKIESNGEVILFLPSDPVNKVGHIQCFLPSEGHSTATEGYMRKCQPLKDKKRIRKLARMYETLGSKQPEYRVIPATYRSTKDRREAYKYI